MKKFFSFMTILSTFLISGYAQSWSLKGNSNASNSSKLGTTNGQNLRIYTNNIERIRVNTVGNVGIGTASPAAKLHLKVNGFDAYQGLAITNANSGGKTLTINQGSLGKLNFTNPGILDLMTLDFNSQRVGIGTTSPAAKLHLNVNGFDAYQGLAITNTNSGGKTLTVNQGTPGKLNFTVPGVVDLVTMDFNSQRVGIGTSSPGSRLQVVAGYDGDGISVVGSSSGPKDAGFSLGDNSGHFGALGLASANNAFMSGTVQGDIILTNRSGKIHLGTGDAIGFPAMTVAGGNVGINNLSPDAKLHLNVNGFDAYQGLAITNTNSGGKTLTINQGTPGKLNFTVPSVVDLVTMDFASQNVGIGTTTPGSKLTVIGDISCSGTVFQTSDARLKKNIHEFADAMAIINKLKPKSYEFKDDKKLVSLNLPKGNHYGLIAQELEGVLPNLVKESTQRLGDIKPITDKQHLNNEKPESKVDEQKEAQVNINIKAVNYTELIPIIIKGMQELSKENDDLKNEIKELKLLISKSGNSPAIAPLGGYLKQNVPNPLNSSAIINYFTPYSTKNAEITVTDMRGSVVKTFAIAKGEGQITIRREDLPAGTYNYTLYINGNKIETKQIVITP
ncbi:tail fiber domain-containing protein [Segetibacter koreensis]|uniref:tail fiber domain-containing protein n=1 Tax=Segetibacter koreensis TaxID=398037 RepID=UPI00035C7120|nr:tail fiber domain-containing protein [Segetibacter koreensis]